MAVGRASSMHSVRILLLLATLGCLPARAGLMLNIDDMGLVIGAAGVDVGGASFDVEFLDGTCDSVYGLCSVSNFIFTTESAALAASQALIGQVFVDNFSDLSASLGFTPIVQGCGSYGCSHTGRAAAVS